MDTTTVPDRVLNEAIVKLDVALEHQKELVTEIKHLRTSNRRLNLIVAVGLVGLIGIGTAVGYAAVAFYEARGNQVESCRDSNVRFDNLMDLLAARSDSDEGRAFIETLRAVSVLDCDDDGERRNDLPTLPTPTGDFD